MDSTIKNQEVYEQTLNEAASTRYELNEQHHKEMGKINAIFRLAFNRPSKYFKLAKDMLYYKGGYPSENTPAKLWTLFNELAVVVGYFKYMDKMDVINSYLRQFGLTVDVDTTQLFIDFDAPVDNLKKKKLQKLKDVYNEVFMPDDEDEILNLSKRDLFKRLMDAAVMRQKTICALSDTIKYDAAERVEEECEIRKSSFMQAVGLKFKMVRDGSITEDLEKIKEKEENLEAALSVLKG